MIAWLEFLLKLDEPAPDIVADTTAGKIAILDFRGKWVVLFAYPADFTPICEMDLIGFARNKPKFDSLGVQFIGWSVDTVESHEKWIRDIKERTGVQIDYPLIADVEKKLAEQYGILHQIKGVTYRGVFIIDPDGILKFSGIYALDVGRSTVEVERIVKVLQRARELSHLTDLDRARELTRSNMPGLANEVERLDPLEEAERIVLAGKENGIVLRLIGGLAIRSHCHGRHSGHLRDYRDIDMFGLGWQYKDIESVLNKLGYHANAEFNLNHGENRLQFLSSGHVKTVDVLLDKFIMQHTIDFRQRIRLDDLTIPITDLLLTKLQMGVRLEVKDAKDVVAILEDHELGHTDGREILNIEHVSELCSREWGLCKSVIYSLDNVRQFIEDGMSVQCVGTEATELVRKLDEIRVSVVSKKKAFRWKVRAMLGDRVKWYNEVEKGASEA
jgi:peroxiredoxin (alkyl hydroperoxide reductase subunit C)